MYRVPVGTNATGSHLTQPFQPTLMKPQGRNVRCHHSLFPCTNGGLARRHAVALKIEKQGAKGCLGGIASSGWLEDHQIQSFSREKLFELCKKNAHVFDVLAMETLPRDSASPEDCSHVGTLQVLVTALRSKRPSAWTLFTSWCCTCCGEKSMWRARRQNLLRGSCDPASSYTPTIPRRPS